MTESSNGPRSDHPKHRALMTETSRAGRPTPLVHMSLSRVPGEEKLYIGGFINLRRKQALADADITHVLSVVRGPIASDLIADFTQLQIEVDDVEHENLLGHFATANRFIRDGLDRGGGVLVHCAMGKSRSATMILAYLLSPFSPSHSPALTPETALSFLRSVRPMAEPNPGFMSQLALYHTMGYPPDPVLHPLYQRWLFACDVEESVASGRVPEEIRFEDELSTAHDRPYGVEGDGKDFPVTSSELGAVAAYETDATAASAELTEYRCRHCRTLLTSTPYLVSHISPPSTSDPNGVPPTGPSWPPTHPSYQPSFPAGPPSLDGCAHVHTHPLSWMRPELTEGKLEGRLDCPGRRCGRNVGKYAWQGLKCSCGVWVTPGFAVAKGRVDAVVKGGKGSEEVGIRLPPGMRRNEGSENGEVKLKMEE